MNPFQKRSVVNPVALGMAKTLWSFGHSECNRIKGKNLVLAREVKVKMTELLPLKVTIYLYSILSLYKVNFTQTSSEHDLHDIVHLLFGDI